MKLFCAYAFTGEDIGQLTARMQMVVDILNDNGHEAYCNRFDTAVEKLQLANDVKGIFKEAFKNISSSDALVAIVASPNRSVGQIMEIGVALSQHKPVYLFEHTSAAESSYLPKLVDKHFVWESVIDLQSALQQI